MTLIQILSEALVQLGLGTDAQTAKDYKRKHLLYANDGADDLAFYMRLRRTEQVSVSGERIDLSALSRGCIKVLAVTRDGMRYPFYFGAGSDEIHVPGLTDGTADICYRYAPKRMSSDSDAPDIPEYLHALLPNYVAAREQMTKDQTQQRRASAYFEQYEAGKRMARRNAGEQDAFTIYNKFC